MREIKFRAWTGEKIIDYIYQEKTSMGWIHIVKNYGFGVKAVMQFTGLLDKNSKEIYEGDILSNENDFQYTVEWEDGGFVFSGEDSISNFFVDQLEIIGNIYENPELLEKDL